FEALRKPSMSAAEVIVENHLFPAAFQRQRGAWLPMYPAPPVTRTANFAPRRCAQQLPSQPSSNLAIRSPACPSHSGGTDLGFACPLKIFANSALSLSLS